MSTFVIVHGAFGGGWEWAPVARILRSQGHDAWTPTLTGLGDRAHLAHARVGLETHTRDVLAGLEAEDLRDVVLCGASYGGMPVTAAADQAADRVGSVIYVDALVPRNEEAAIDLLPPSFRTSLRARARRTTARSWQVPVPRAVLPPRRGIPAARWAKYVSRLVPQPAVTFTQPLRLTGAIERIPRAFVRCTMSTLKDDPIEAMAARARQLRWPFFEIAAPHDPHLFDPAATASALIEASRALKRASRGRRDRQRTA